MPNVGPLEILIIMIIALIVLGPKKLPELARSAGKGMREFRNAVSMDSRESEREEEQERSKDREQVGSGT
jgi:sec-independent protein translocase protein TatA